jgi:phage N-6-adenine-methyltransferase
MEATEKQLGVGLVVWDMGGIASLADTITLGRHGGARRGAGRPKAVIQDCDEKSTILKFNQDYRTSSTILKSGTASYWIARLDRDGRRKLASQVRDGKLSANAAAIKAGYRKRVRRDKLAVHHSSKRQDWGTPQVFFDKLNARFGFTLDVCASEWNAKCKDYYSEDALAKPWVGICWMNPPYGREIKKWMKKAWESAQAGATIVCLVPSRTGPSWWHEYATKGEIEFLQSRRHRLKCESPAWVSGALLSCDHQNRGATRGQHAKDGEPHAVPRYSATTDFASAIRVPLRSERQCVAAR